MLCHVRAPHALLKWACIKIVYKVEHAHYGCLAHCDLVLLHDGSWTWEFPL